MNTFARTLWLPFISLYEALMPFRITKEETRIVPKASISGRALFLVIIIMSFLASLTAASVSMINESANSWYNDIASEVTVQVNIINGVNMQRRVQKVSAFLRRQPGIANVTPLTLADSADLLEPWLGKSAALNELPIPRLIAVKIDQKSPADLKRIDRRLKNEFKKVKLDDHRHWQNQIRKMTHALAVIGLTILFLVAFATFAIVLSATRAAMATNRDIIEVLHFVGAKQHFIAHEFEKHFLVMGIRAGLIGAIMAALSFKLVPTFLSLMSGQSGGSNEYQQLFGSISMNSQSYLALLIIVVVVSAICMLTSRYWVDRILRQEGTIANPISPHSKSKKSKFKASAKHNPTASYAAKSTPKKKGSFLSSMMGLVSYMAFALIGASLLGFVLFVFALDKKSKQLKVRTDGIVVFTGAPLRINKAVQLLSAGKAKRLLISGVGSHTQKKELMRRVPSSVPLFNCCIDIGKRAQNTIGNASESKEWVSHHRFKSLLVVTSNYHIPRALLLTRKELPNLKITGYSVQSRSFRDGSWWHSPTAIALIFEEYLKYVVTFVRVKFL